MQPGWSHCRIGGLAAVSKIGSDKRRRIAISMGNAPSAGKDAACRADRQFG
jgi:hypothetical protein